MQTVQLNMHFTPFPLVFFVVFFFSPFCTPQTLTLTHAHTPFRDTYTLWQIVCLLSYSVSSLIVNRRELSSEHSCLNVSYHRTTIYCQLK